jgi:hypothetical protein
VPAVALDDVVDLRLDALGVRGHLRRVEQKQGFSAAYYPAV